jgi:hypothetical protein
MNELRKGLPIVPPRMRHLAIESRGYPVPWFVAWFNGEPDFRVIRPGGLESATANRTCWLCGEKMGRYITFVIGPMCAVNRVSSEPACHLDCAEFAAKACPFMVLPSAKRREANLPKDGIAPVGNHIERNPGATCLWTCKHFRPFQVDHGFLIEIGEPDHVEWWAKGRSATQKEVLDSIDSGMPLLLGMTENDRERQELNRKYREAMHLLPQEVAV